MLKLVAALIIAAALLGASAMHRYKAIPLDTGKLGAMNTGFAVVDGLTGRTWVCIGIASACHVADGGPAD